MSVPKKRRTSSSRNRRRSHHALKQTELVKCSRCKTMILPHKVCKNCGYYNGEEIIKIELALDKKAKKAKEKEAKQ